MQSFGQRIGRRPISDVIQIDSIDDATRIALWNTIHSVLKRLYDRGSTSGPPLMQTMWAEVLKRPLDEYGWSYCEGAIKRILTREDWVDALEIVEGFAMALDTSLGKDHGAAYRAIANETLSKGLIGYRFVGAVLAQVDDDQSAAEIASAIASASDTARSHLERAASLLADRHNPQYVKVAGEAINAVEASVYSLTGKKTLGDGVKELGKRGLPVHPAIVKAWSSMYGYSSDAGGIRHANIGGEEVDAAMAVYLFVTCSAFINLLSKVAASGPE